jgi:RHS repeat-associated protein
VSTVLPGGVRQDRVVDAAGQIGQVANSGSTGLIRSFQYTRDASGNPTAVIANGPAGVLEGQSQLFTYDNANRLRKACWTAVACKNANQTAWTYDVVGKRLTEKVGAAPAKAFTYDAQTDQLTQTVDGTQITNFVYDANGNQLQSGGTVSTFNAANQTVSVTEAAIASTYTYDGDGLRVSDTLNQFGTLTTTRFDWDTVSSGLANVVADHRSGGNGVNNNRFTYGLGLVSSEASDHVRSFSLTDPLGTVTQVSSSAGAVRWSGSTGPFGDLHDSVAAPGDPYGSELLRYRFTGQYDAGFGLTHMRARNYNASLGAFTQTDPLQASVGSAYPSAYVYGNNNPMVFRDPTGLRGITGTSGRSADLVQSGELSFRIARTPDGTDIPVTNRERFRIGSSAINPGKDGNSKTDPTSIILNLQKDWANTQYCETHKGDYHCLQYFAIAKLSSEKSRSFRIFLLNNRPGINPTAVLADGAKTGSRVSKPS